MNGRHLVVPCAGIPGTVVPKGFVLDWIGYDVVWVAARRTVIPRSGRVDIAAVLEHHEVARRYRGECNG